MPMATCATCGMVSADESHFCPRCGSSLGVAAAPAPPQTWASPPQYQAGYGQYWPPAQKTNSMAIASLVLGILPLCGVGSILALVFGYMAKSQIDRSGGAETGRGTAVAGIVLGWIWVGIAALVIVLAVI